LKTIQVRLQGISAELAAYRIVEVNGLFVTFHDQKALNLTKELAWSRSLKDALDAIERESGAKAFIASEL
jgi:hypothetical protein